MENYIGYAFEDLAENDMMDIDGGGALQSAQASAKFSTWKGALVSALVSIVATLVIGD